MSALDEIMATIAATRPSQVVASPAMAALQEALLRQENERSYEPRASTVPPGMMVWEISDDHDNTDILDWCASIGAKPVYRRDVDDGQCISEGVFMVELEERHRVEFMLRCSENIDRPRYLKQYGNFFPADYFVTEVNYGIGCIMESCGLAEWTGSEEYWLDTGD